MQSVSERRRNYRMTNVRPSRKPYLSPVLDEAGLTVFEFRVLGHVAAISSFGWARSSCVRTARRTGLAPESVARAMRSLVELKQIEEHRPPSLPEIHSIGPAFVRLAHAESPLIVAPIEVEVAKLAITQYRVFYHVICCKSSEWGCTCRLLEMSERLRMHWADAKAAVDRLLAGGWLRCAGLDALVPRS